MIGLLKKYYRAAPFVIIIFIIFYYAVMIFPEIQILEINDPTISNKDLASLENEYRKTILQIIAGTAVAIGLYLTYKRIKVTEDGQVTERFTKAIEHLGSKQPSICIGGIYALERIAKDSPKDHWMVMEILSSYIRENSSLETNNPNTSQGDFFDPLSNPSSYSKNKIEASIQSALSVILRRNTKNDQRGSQIDLRNCFLSGCTISNASMDNLIIEGSHMTNSVIENTTFENISLTNVKFNNSNINNVNFIKIRCENFEMQNSVINKMNIDQCNFYASDFTSLETQSFNVKNTFFSFSFLSGIKFVISRTPERSNQLSNNKYSGCDTNLETQLSTQDQEMKDFIKSRSI
ncbi:MAG: hypothetical protein AAFR91_09775 [Pseudomonadota bacterium]